MQVLHTNANDHREADSSWMGGANSNATAVGTYVQWHTAVAER